MFKIFFLLICKTRYSKMVKNKDMQFFMENLKMKRKKEQKKLIFWSGNLNPRFSVIFLPMIWIFLESEELEIKSKQASKRDGTLIEIKLMFLFHEIVSIFKNRSFGDFYQFLVIFLSFQFFNLKWTYSKLLHIINGTCSEDVLLGPYNFWMELLILDHCCCGLMTKGLPNSPNYYLCF